MCTYVVLSRIFLLLLFFWWYHNRIKRSEDYSLTGVKVLSRGAEGCSDLYLLKAVKESSNDASRGYAAVMGNVSNLFFFCNLRTTPERQ